MARVLDAAGPRPVLFRTLELGGDKLLPGSAPTEENPAMGWRSLRVGLDRPALLRRQLRALLLAGAIWSMMAFGLAYAIYRRTDNASVVDAIWAFTLGGAGVLYAGLGAGDPMRRLALALMAGTWGVRLGWHLVQRIRSGPEDARYERLRESVLAERHPVHWHMAPSFCVESPRPSGRSLSFSAWPCLGGGARFWCFFFLS